MSYERWAEQHNSDSALLRECWDTAQAALKEKLKQKLGDANGYVDRKFYPKLSDVVKEL